MEDLMQYINRGGMIVYLLIGMNILGFTIMLWKLIQIIIAKYQHEKLTDEIFDFIKSTNQKYNKTSLKNGLHREVQKLEYGLGTVKIIALTAPLLGLLGTVIGVLSAFDAITRYGLDDPTIFSGGISIALITTVAGLIVAIPHHVGYNYLIGKVDNFELELEKEILEKL